MGKGGAWVRAEHVADEPHAGPLPRRDAQPVAHIHETQEAARDTQARHAAGRGGDERGSREGCRAKEHGHGPSVSVMLRGDCSKRRHEGGRKPGDRVHPAGGCGAHVGCLLR